MSHQGANHGQAYGFSAEVAAKIASKMDPALEAEARGFIKAKTGADIASGQLEQELNNGMVLAQLCNAIKPGSVKVPAKAPGLPFKKMELIGQSLDAIMKIGVAEQDVFATVDLYEGKNMVKVIDTLIALKRITK